MSNSLILPNQAPSISVNYALSIAGNQIVLRWQISGVTEGALNFAPDIALKLAEGLKAHAASIDAAEIAARNHVITPAADLFRREDR